MMPTDMKTRLLLLLVVVAALIALHHSGWEPPNDPLPTSPYRSTWYEADDKDQYLLDQMELDSAKAHLKTVELLTQREYEKALSLLPDVEATAEKHAVVTIDRPIPPGVNRALLPARQGHWSPDAEYVPVEVRFEKTISLSSGKIRWKLSPGFEVF